MTHTNDQTIVHLIRPQNRILIYFAQHLQTTYFQREFLKIYITGEVKTKYDNSTLWGLKIMK